MFSMLIFYIIYLLKYKILFASLFLLLSLTFLLLIYFIIYKKIDLINLINFSLITFIGLNSIFFKNFLFIQWKVAMLNITLAIIFLFNQFFMKKIYSKYF
ncbi:septation protein IspZ [Buchnera aphidicola]|uniref:septation protein IspZ n=1 Tax=Buchnera aphidicola TaxID=9 RepID=UPI003D1879F9